MVPGNYDYNYYMFHCIGQTVWLLWTPHIIIVTQCLHACFIELLFTDSGSGVAIIVLDCILQQNLHLVPAVQTEQLHYL